MRNIAPRVDLQAVCKTFDELKKGGAAANLDNLFIFSNVLDIPSFDATALLVKAFQPGRNVVAAVSPDRDFDGGTARLIDLQKRIAAGALGLRLETIRNELTTFTCDNPGRAPAVLWICEVNVRG